MDVSEASLAKNSKHLIIPLYSETLGCVQVVEHPAPKSGQLEPLLEERALDSAAHCAPMDVLSEGDSFSYGEV